MKLEITARLKTTSRGYEITLDDGTEISILASYHERDYPGTEPIRRGEIGLVMSGRILPRTISAYKGPKAKFWDWADAEIRKYLEEPKLREKQA